MNRYLLLFMGLLVLEIVLCTIQKYVFLSNLGTIPGIFKNVLIYATINSGFTDWLQMELIIWERKRMCHQLACQQTCQPFLLFSAISFLFPYTQRQVILGNSSVKQLKILDNLLLLCNVLEVQKFTSSQFFGWDLKLYCESTDEPAICNTSDLNEELGQVFDFTTLIIKIEIIETCYSSGTVSFHR